MALPGNKNFSDYDNYVTDPNPTTSAQAQDYFRNQAELLKAVIDCDFWQPETVYQPGDVVKSDSMPNGTEAVMVANKAGVTSNVEPQWGAVGGANVSDGTCFWRLRWQHWSKSVASVDDMKNGTSNDKIVTPELARLGRIATNRLPNTAYAVGNVVYVDSNLSVALKCTQAGTTSNAELDVSGKNIGGTVTDGSVVWQVVKRDLTDNFENYLPLNGGTMNSTINFMNLVALKKLTNAESLQINGGVDFNNGAYLVLYGAENRSNAGEFNLATAKNETIYKLRGYPNGLLTWNDNSVITTNEVQQGRGIDYYLTPGQIRRITITYPKALKKVVYPKCWLARDSGYHYNMITIQTVNPTTTGFEVILDNANLTENFYVSFYWEVIGEVAL